MYSPPRHHRCIASQACDDSVDTRNQAFTSAATHEAMAIASADVLSPQKTAASEPCFARRTAYGHVGPGSRGQALARKGIGGFWRSSQHDVADQLDRLLEA